MSDREFEYGIQWYNPLSLHSVRLTEALDVDQAVRHAKYLKNMGLVARPVRRRINDGPAEDQYWEELP